MFFVGEDTFSAGESGKLDFIKREMLERGSCGDGPWFQLGAQLQAVGSGELMMRFCGVRGRKTVSSGICSLLQRIPSPHFPPAALSDSDNRHSAGLVLDHVS